MTDKKEKRPDHTLQAADVDGGDEAPVVYAVADLRAFVKPALAEELGAPMGGPAECGTEVVCTCVPVETCVCDMVVYHEGPSSERLTIEKVAATYSACCLLMTPLVAKPKLS